MMLKPTIKVEHLDHLGIIASIIKEKGLIEIIDELLPKRSNNVGLSHGNAILAMIYMGLGVSGRGLYKIKKFFKNRTLEDLFEGDVKIEQLNDDALGSALDAIHNYGVKRFFCDVAFRTLSTNNLLTLLAYLDTTSISFNSKKNHLVAIYLLLTATLKIIEKTFHN